MTEALLQLNGVTKCFRTGDDEVVVLEAIDLSIDPGEFVAIVGASGSGKSTLMNILGCASPSNSRVSRPAAIG